MFKSIITRLKQFSFFNAFLHTSTYFGAQIVIQALGIISLPVYTYFLTTGEYGIVNVYLSYVSTLVVLMSFNFNGAIARYYYEEKSDFKSFMGTSFISAFTPYFFFSIIIYIYRAPLAEWINLPVSVIPWLLIFGATIILWRMYEHLKVAQHKSLEYSLSQIVLQYAKFGFAVMGILYLEETAYLGKVGGEAIAAVLMSGYFLFKLIPWIRLTFSWDHLKYIANYSLPLIPVVLSGHILNAFDLWFINPTLGEESAGLYSFAYKVGFLLTGLITALHNGSNPDYYKLMNAQNYDDVNSQFISVLKFLFLGAIFLIYFGGDLGHLLASNKTYTVSLDIVPVIVLGYVFFGIAQFIYRYILFQKKNTWLIFLLITVALINVILNYLFIPTYGYKIAAVTTMVSYAIMLLLSYLIVVVIMKAPGIPTGKLVRLSLIFALFLAFAIYFHFNVTHYLLSLSIRCLLFLALGWILFQDKLKAVLFPDKDNG